MSFLLTAHEKKGASKGERESQNSNARKKKG